MLQDAKIPAVNYLPLKRGGEPQSTNLTAKGYLSRDLLVGWQLVGTAEKP